MSKNIEKAISKCRAYAKKLELPMNIIGAKYDAENSKLVFQFESQKRVDFRELLKLLQNELSVKIELRQVGPRDQAKEMGGIGPCGRIVCCQRYMKKFESVSVRLIKKQGLKGSPQRYAGYCGKLQCCLRFELDEKKNKENARRSGETFVGTVKRPFRTVSPPLLQNLSIVSITMHKEEVRQDKDNEHYHTAPNFVIARRITCQSPAHG